MNLYVYFMTDQSHPHWPQEKILFNFHNITLLLTMLVWSGWLNIDLTLFFFSFLWTGKTKEVQGGAIVAISSLYYH